jgi:hypothetical protein
LRGTQAGPLCLTAAFSLRDAAEPYQLVIQPRAGAATPPGITKDQYDDLINFLSAFVPVGVEAVARGVRPYVHGFPRPARWDRLPAGSTFPRDRADR